MKFKLGKKPARKEAKRLWLSKYLDRSRFRLNVSKPADWGANALKAAPRAWVDPLGNEERGCCVWSGTFRAMMARMASLGMLGDIDPAIATQIVLNAYASTGFDPVSGSGDNGTDPIQAMQYLHDTGFILPGNVAHKIGICTWINPQDFEGILTALQLFDGIGIGLEFAQEWEDLPVWKSSKNIIGGHWVFGFSDLNVTPKGVKINTWGQDRIVTPECLATNGDEIGVIIAPDMFTTQGVSVQGFDYTQLLADARALPQANA